MTVIWHNPRCSKSRQTLAIVQAKDPFHKVRLYLQDPPSADEIREALAKLQMKAAQLVRRGEAAFKDGTEDELIALMAENPILIERPIVIVGNQAVIGRPPEDALDLFD